MQWGKLAQHGCTMSRRAIVLIDGENLLHRFEEQQAGSANTDPNVEHADGEYVWTARIASHRAWDLLRVNYYTTCVGDDQALANLRGKLSSLTFKFLRPSKFRDHGSVVPHVFKKPKKEQKTASVDINITIDMLRHTYSGAVDEFFLLTGDGDFLPLIEEVMRQGKVVYAGAFSTGLHPGIPTTVDEFVDLDTLFFK